MADPIDFTRIQETSDGDMEFEAELIEMYLEDAQMHVDNIGAQVSSGDGAQLKTTAHTLKGSSANIGAVGMQEVAAALEKCTNDDLSGGEDLYARLTSVFADTRKAFEAYVAENQ